MPSTPISDDEVIALGKKLDEFGEVLTEKERLLMLALISAAHQHFVSVSTEPATTTTLPKLGPAFDAAFIPGRAAEFEAQSERGWAGPLVITGGVVSGPGGPTISGGVTWTIGKK